MSEKTAALLEAFETLAPNEKLDFANAVFRRLPPINSGPLDDKEAAAAGDTIAEMLDKEENDAKARSSMDVRLRHGGEGPPGADSERSFLRR